MHGIAFVFNSNVAMKSLSIGQVAPHLSFCGHLWIGPWINNKLQLAV